MTDTTPDYEKPTTKYREAKHFYMEVVLNYGGDDCLIWPFYRDKDGYGYIGVNGKMVRTHRAVCLEVHGKPPHPSYHAAHSCGNGHLGCVTKGHISWKSPIENKADELVHGTRNRGERNGRGKLRSADVRRIRSLRGKIGQISLAKQYNVAPSTISHIQSGKGWRHVD